MSVSLASDKLGEEGWWNGGDPVRTRLLDAISLLLPGGERFVIDSVSDWLRLSRTDSQDCASLRSEAERFVREESAHQCAHRRYNERLAGAAGVAAFGQEIESAVQQLGGCSFPFRFALCAAFEHLTNSLWEEILRPGSVWLSAGESAQEMLWRWHCREEIGHRHVAADVARAAGVRAGLRALTFLAAVVFLAGDVARGMRVLSRHDIAVGRVSRRRLAISTANLLAFSLPSILRMAWRALQYVLGLERGL